MGKKNYYSDGHDSKKGSTRTSSESESSYSDDENIQHCLRKITKQLKGLKCKDGKDGKDGRDGKNGYNGKDGKNGFDGMRGKRGKNGYDGKDGKDGENGKDGINGANGENGTNGTNGQDGQDGQDGQNGLNAVINYANFYSLQPLDNLLPVIPGGELIFAQDGPQFGTITRLTPSTFNLQDIGMYSVQFNVPIKEAAELVLVLNGTELPATLVGRFTPETQLTGTFIIQTTQLNSVLSVINPVGAPNILTISDLAGGSGKPLSMNLVIMKL